MDGSLLQEDEEVVDEVRKRPALEILRYDEPDESTDSPLSYNVPRRD